MMLKLLEIKEGIKHMCEKYGIYVKIVVKFLVAMIMLLLINSNMGYNQSIDNVVILLGISVVCAIVPDAVALMIICLITAFEAYSVSVILAVTVIVVYLIMYFMYVRYVPFQAYVILFIPFLYLLRIQYVIPLVCGIMMSPISIVSCMCGILIFYIYMSIGHAAMVYESVGLSDTINFYNVVVDDIKNNKFMFFTIVVFAIIILITYVLRRQKIKHASYIAIWVGVVINIVSFLLATAFIDHSDVVVNVLLGSIVGGVIASVVQFFRMTLDYSGTKHVQFEDDEYYYYVKAVPKYTVSPPEKQVMRIHAQKPTNNTANLQDAITHIYDESVK